jgi:hypothetical protein
MTKPRTTAADLARLAVDEAARLCDGRTLDAARDALNRSAWREAVLEAVRAAYVAGKVTGARVRNQASGNRPQAQDYRAAIALLALKVRAPLSEVRELAERHGKTVDAVGRAIKRARERIVRGKTGTATASGLRATIR